MPSSHFISCTTLASVGKKTVSLTYRHLPSLSFHLFRQSPRCLRDQEPTPMIRLDITLSFAAHLFPSVFILCCYFWGQLLNNKQLHLVRIEVSWWNEWPLSNYLKCRLEYFWDLNTDIQTFTQDTHVDSHGILIDLSWLHQSYHVNRVVTIWQTQYD